MDPFVAAHRSGEAITGVAQVATVLCIRFAAAFGHPSIRILHHSTGGLSLCTLEQRIHHCGSRKRMVRRMARMILACSGMYGGSSD